MAHGRKITLHLVEGIPNGVKKAQLGNWVGKVTYVPVLSFAKLKNDKDVQGLGVYVLSERKHSERPRVYIGQSERVYKRISYHLSKPENAIFDAVTIITSVDESLTQSDINYLEGRLIQIAKEANSVTAENKNNSQRNHLSEADRAEMEQFLENLEILLPVIGLNFISSPPETQLASKELITFHSSTKIQGESLVVEAKAQIRNERFYVLKGSQAFKRSESPSYKDLKDQLIEDKVLIEEGGVLVFINDVPFTSPSAAAAVIRGKNVNGRTFWKLADGSDYGDWFDSRIKTEDQSE